MGGLVASFSYRAVLGSYFVGQFESFISLSFYGLSRNAFNLTFKPQPSRTRKLGIPLGLVPQFEFECSEYQWVICQTETLPEAATAAHGGKQV